MATTDPVNAAVARALAYGTELVKSGQTVDFAPRNILPWAAREALAPVRKWYEVEMAVGGVPDWEGLANLIYTTEELNQ